MAQTNIFFSWQSDLTPAANRSLIQNALEAAARAISSDLEIEAVVDRDTLGLGGSPNIRDAIFSKIDDAAVFIADVTPINAGTNTRLSPNPNVLVELGYAIKSIGWSRIVLVLNTAYCPRVEDLPFDIRGHRCMRYESKPDDTDRATERKRLQAQFREALGDVLKNPLPAAYPAELEVSYKAEHRTQERHDYVLHLKLKNRGTAAIKNWFMTVEMPRDVLRPGMTYAHQDNSMSNRRSAYFRFTGADSPLPQKTLYPDATEERTIPYYMDDDLFDSDRVAQQSVVVKAYIDDKLVQEVTVPFSKLNNF